MKIIKKAIILAGGLNSRMLPISKVIPKVMLPYKDKLTVQYHVEECMKSGVEEIIFVVRDDNSLIKKYFEPDLKLNLLLLKHGKKDVIDVLSKIETCCKITFIKQEEPLGEADAVYAARDVVNGDDIAVLLGDTIYISDEPAIKQLYIRCSDGEEKLYMGDSRFIFSHKSFHLFCNRYRKERDKLDKKIQDMFAEKEICFHGITGKRVRVGELENYRKLFVE